MSRPASGITFNLYLRFKVMLSMHFLKLTVGATSCTDTQPLPRVVKSTGNAQPEHAGNRVSADVRRG
ncbi:hypothetical protein GCM10022239_19850 [Leifsonia bigeumensis]|uniref:Uncharacterized protein n=1 Tax=Leifsonella bigeumensis TaxID=433643 RepID=A0ABP7FU16_9MICO